MPLTTVRLAGNALFRFLYPFLGVVAVDVGLGASASGLLLTGLAVGGMSTPLARRAVAGRGESPRRLATAGLALLALGTLVLAGAAPALAGRGPLLGAAVALLGAAVLGTAKPLLDVGSIGYVSERVPFARRARATSVMELTWAGGLLVLAPVGALAAATSWRVALLGLGAVAALGAVWVWRVLDTDAPREGRHAGGATDDGATAPTPPPVDVPGGAPTAAQGADAQDGAATSGAASDGGAAWRFLLVASLLFVALESTFGVVGLWLEEVREVDPALLGAFTAIGAVGELLGSLVVLVLGDRLGKLRLVVVGLLACAVGFGALPYVEPLPLALGALALGLFGTETAIVAAIPLGSEVMPGARTWFLSRMVAVTSVARAAAGALGPALLLGVGLWANAGISAVAALAAVLVALDLARRVPWLR